MDLEDIMLSEISQIEEKKTPYDWNLKKSPKTNEQTKQKQTHRYREQICGYQRGLAGRDGQNG